MSKVDRRYSPVVRTIWSHPKFADLSKPKPNAQTLVLRLLIAEEGTSVPGLYRALEAGIAQQLEWSLKSFREKFKEAADAGWVVADWKRGVVWIPSAIDQDANQPANPNVVRSWKQLLSEIPECEIKKRAIASLVEWAAKKGENWSEALGEALGKRPPMQSPNPSGKGKAKGSPNHAPNPLVKGSPIQEQEQEDPPPPPQGGELQELQVPCPSPVLPQDVVEQIAGHYQVPAAVVRETEQIFKNYWIAGKGAGKRFTMGVWMAKCREWIRRAYEAGELKTGSDDASEAPWSN